MNKKQCNICMKFISLNNFDKHYNSKSCLRNINKTSIIKIDSLNIINNLYECPYCFKLYVKNGIGYHIWKNHGDGINWNNNNIGFLNNDRIIWNKGFTKESNDSIKKSIETYNRNKLNGLHKQNKSKLSLEHKIAISNGMKKAHLNGKAHNIGQSRWNNKKSYPEIFFEKVILNEFIDKNFVNEYPFYIYSLDFAWVDKKKVIEIDGQQHEKQEYKERDIKKDLKLEENDWKVLRIKWIDLYNNPKYWIEKAKNFIDI